MQWVVIAVLVIGGGIATYMLVHKTDDYKDQVDSQQGSLSSLRKQVDELRHPTPTPPDPLPEATANGPAGATPTPTPTPAATPKTTPRPTATPR